MKDVYKNRHFLYTFPPTCKENAIPFTRYSQYGKKMPFSFYVALHNKHDRPTKRLRENAIRK